MNEKNRVTQFIALHIKKIDNKEEQWKQKVLLVVIMLMDWGWVGKKVVPSVTSS